MVKDWIQFSVWDDKWPHRAITDFLPALEKEIPEGIRWHFLYEPNLLVRIEAEDSETAVRMAIKADHLAMKLDYHIAMGDISKKADDDTGGFIFRGDLDFYGPILWEANADFLHATSKLILRMSETGQLTPKMLRKHIHLLCNQSGRNYLQEFWLILRHTLRSFHLFLRYGFN